MSSKYRRFSIGSKFAPSAAQVNAWTDAAISNEQRNPRTDSRKRPPFLVVKTKEDHPKGATLNCIVMVGAKGEEEESDSEAPCFNRFSQLDEGTLCIAAFVVNGWELIAATCGDDDAEPEEGE